MEQSTNPLLQDMKPYEKMYNKLKRGVDSEDMATALSRLYVARRNNKKPEEVTFDEVKTFTGVDNAKAAVEKIRDILAVRFEPDELDTFLGLSQEEQKEKVTDRFTEVKMKKHWSALVAQPLEVKPEYKDESDYEQYKNKFVDELTQKSRKKQIALYEKILPVQQRKFAEMLVNTKDPEKLNLVSYYALPQEQRDQILGYAAALNPELDKGFFEEAGLRFVTGAKRSVQAMLATLRTAQSYKTGKDFATVLALELGEDGLTKVTDGKGNWTNEGRAKVNGILKQHFPELDTFSDEANTTKLFTGERIGSKAIEIYKRFMSGAPVAMVRDQLQTIEKRTMSAVSQDKYKKRGLLADGFMGAVEMAPDLMAMAAIGYTTKSGNAVSAYSMARFHGDFVETLIYDHKVDPQTANTIGAITAVPYAWVEKTQLMQLKTMDPKMLQALATESWKTATMQVLKERAITTAYEITEEGLQAVIEGAGQIAARELAGAQGITDEDVIESIKQEFIAAAKSMPWVSGAPGTVDLLRVTKARLGDPAQYLKRREAVKAVSQELEGSDDLNDEIMKAILPRWFEAETVKDQNEILQSVGMEQSESNRRIMDEIRNIIEEEKARIEEEQQREIDELPGKPVQEVEISQIKLSKDVPNFKKDANHRTGVVEGQELSGEYQRIGTAPIVVWERVNGDLEVITGRHRLDLARRSGEATIPAQVVKESEGFDRDQAAAFDATSNIRDGAGSVADFALFFEKSNLTQEEAEAQGLLAREKGKQGYQIGKNASEDLRALYRAGKITAQKAAAIAEAAPNDQKFQQLGIKFATPDKSTHEIKNFITLAKSRLDAANSTGGDMDLFGFDDSAIVEMEKLAATAAEKVTVLERDRRILNAALTRAGKLQLTTAEAKRLGIPNNKRNDRDAIEKRYDEVVAELARWDRWTTDAELFGQVKEAAANKIRLGEEEGLYNADSSIDVVSIHSEALNKSEMKTALKKQQKKGAILNKSGNFLISLNRKGIKKTIDTLLKSKVPKATAIVGQLDELLEKSVLIYSHKDRADDPHILEINRLFAPVLIDEKLYRTKITVKKIKGELTRKHYEATIQNIEFVSKEADAIIPVTIAKENSQRTAESSSTSLRVKIKTFMEGYNDENNDFSFNNNYKQENHINLTGLIEEAKLIDYFKSTGVPGEKATEAAQSLLREFQLSNDPQQLFFDFSDSAESRRDVSDGRRKGDNSVSQRLGNEVSKSNAEIKTGQEKRTKEVLDWMKQVILDKELLGDDYETEFNNTHNALIREDEKKSRYKEIKDQEILDVIPMGNKLPGELPANIPASTIIPNLINQKSNLEYMVGKTINNAEDAFILLSAVRNPLFESTKFIFLDKNKRVLGAEITSVGTIDSANIKLPKAAPDGTVSVIFSHNHPSGNPQPSPQDIKATEKLRDIHEKIGLELEDHIITNGTKFYSFERQKVENFYFEDAIFDHQDWEVVERSNRTLPKLNHPEVAYRTSSILKQQGEGKDSFVIYLDTGLQITAVERVLPKDYQGQEKFGERTLDRAQMLGAKSFILHLGENWKEDGLTIEEMNYLVEMGYKGRKLNDIITHDGEKFVSLRMVQDKFDMRDQSPLVDQVYLREDGEQYQNAQAERQELLERSSDIAVTIAGEMMKGKNITTRDIKRYLDKVGRDADPNAIMFQAERLIDNVKAQRDELSSDEPINQQLKKAALNQRFKSVIDRAYFTGMDEGDMIAEARERVKQRMKQELLNKADSRTGISPQDFRKLTGKNIVEMLKQVVLLANAEPAQKKKEKVDHHKPGTPKDQDLLDPNLEPVKWQPVKPEEVEKVLGEIKEQVRQKLVGEKYFTDRKKSFESDPVFRAEYRRTLQKALQGLVRELTFGSARERIMIAIRKLDDAAQTKTVENYAKNIIEDINQARTKENLDDTIRKIQKILKKKMVRKQISQTEEYEKRELDPASAEFLKRAGKYVGMGHDKWVDAVAELTDKINNGAPADVKDVDAWTNDLLDEIEVAQTFGALKSRTMEEAVKALEKIQETFEEGRAKVEAAREERKERIGQKREALVDGMGQSGKVSNPGNVTDQADGYAAETMGFNHKLEDMLRFGDSAEGKQVAADIWRDINRATQRENNALEQQRVKFVTAIEDIYGHKADKVLRELEAPDPRFNHLSKQNRVLSRSNLIQIYVTQQPDFMENLELHGRDAAYMNEVAKHLTDQDFKLIVWMQEFYRNERAELSKVSKSVTGLEIVSPGEDYMPRRVKLDKQGLDEQHITSVIVPKAHNPRRRHGHDLDEEASVIGLFDQRLRENEHYKAFAQLAIELRGVFSAARFRESMETIHGKSYEKAFNEHLTDIINGGYNGGKRLPILDWLRDWYTLTKLSANIGVMIKQVSSVPAFALEIGMLQTGKHMATAFTADGIAAMKIIWRSINRQARFAGGQTEAIGHAIRSNKPGLIRRIYQAGMVTNSWGDIVPTLVIGQGIFRAKHAANIEAGMTEAEAQQVALDDTWGIVEATQQSGQQKDLSGWQRRGATFGKLLGQFASTTRQYAAYEVKDIRALMAKMKTDGVLKGVWSAQGAKALQTLALNHIVLPALFQGLGALWRAILGTDIDDEDEKEWLISSMIAGPASGLIFVGSLVTGMADYLSSGKKSFDSSVTPAAGMVKDAQAFTALLKAAATLDGEEVLTEADKVLKSNNAPYRDVRKATENYQIY